MECRRYIQHSLCAPRKSDLDQAAGGWRTIVGTPCHLLTCSWTHISSSICRAGSWGRGQRELGEGRGRGRGLFLSGPGSLSHPPAPAPTTTHLHTQRGGEGEDWETGGGRQRRSALELELAWWVLAPPELAARVSVRGRARAREGERGRLREERGEGEQALRQHEDGLLFSVLS